MPRRDAGTVTQRSGEPSSTSRHDLDKGRLKVNQSLHCIVVWRTAALQWQVMILRRR